MKITITLTLMILILITVSYADNNTEELFLPPVDLQNLNGKEAIVWYLGHCGFAVKTKNYFLIFDYRPWPPVPDKLSLNKGFIDPEEIKDLKVRVFVSHSHADHYDPVIFEWEKTVKDIKYFFGWKAFEHSLYNYLPAPIASMKSDDMEIFTINSHHSGVPEVAYLVNVDGLAIYHAGDCKADYEADFPYFQTKSKNIDFIFVNSVYTEGHHYTLMHMDMIKRFNVKAVFPQHAVDDEQDYKKFKTYYRDKGFSVPILCPEEKGDNYIYKNGIMKEVKK